MASVTEITIIDAADQQLDTVLNGTPVTLRFWFNAFANRWSMDLAVNRVQVLNGRRMVPGSDLLAGLGLNLGKLALLDFNAQGAEPGRAELPAGLYRLYSLA